MSNTLGEGTEGDLLLVNVNEAKYDFSADGQLVNLKTGGGFVFTTQSDYELLGEWVTERIYQLLISPPYSLRCKLLSGEDVTNLNAFPTTQSFVFVSSNFENAEKLVVLIHGTGVVRAGQWSRRLIINESLEVGTQLPYIQRCLTEGWAVLVLNTNDNFYLDNNAKKTPKPMSATAEEHGVNAWKKFVTGSTRKKSQIAIVAHSYGGKVTMAILSTLSSEDLARIRSISLTDALFSSQIFAKIDHKIPTRNWVVSERPLDEPLSALHVSAGTTEHERSSPSAIDSVFKFISESFES